MELVPMTVFEVLDLHVNDQVTYVSGLKPSSTIAVGTVVQNMRNTWIRIRLDKICQGTRFRIGEDLLAAHLCVYCPVFSPSDFAKLHQGTWLKLRNTGGVYQARVTTVELIDKRPNQFGQRKVRVVSDQPERGLELYVSSESVQQL